MCLRAARRARFNGATVDDIAAAGGLSPSFLGDFASSKKAQCRTSWRRWATPSPSSSRPGRQVSRSALSPRQAFDDSWPCHRPPRRRESAGIRSETAMRRRLTGEATIAVYYRRAFPQLKAGVVGLAGLEPAASSLSGQRQPPTTHRGTIQSRPSQQVIRGVQRTIVRPRMASPWFVADKLLTRYPVPCTRAGPAACFLLVARRWTTMDTARGSDGERSSIVRTGRDCG